MTIYSAADMGTYEEFLKLFKEGDQNKISSSGRSLLFIALCNTKSKERYRIANFLINKGADVKIIQKSLNLGNKKKGKLIIEGIGVYPKPWTNKLKTSFLFVKI